MAGIQIDADRCCGHGRCYTLAPELFTADDDGRGEVLRADPGDALLDKARSAAANCPEQAIRVED